MTKIEEIKPQAVIAEYYEEKRERAIIVEKNRRNMEKTLETRRVIEEKRNLESFPGGLEIEIETQEAMEHLFEDTYEEQDFQFITNDCIFEDEHINDDYEAGIEEVEEDTEFILWMKSISQCLSGKISQDVVRPASPESEEEEEKVEEDVRCMNVVKSVFDEDTATVLVKEYLKYGKVFNPIMLCYIYIY